MSRILVAATAALLAAGPVLGQSVALTVGVGPFDATDQAYVTDWEDLVQAQTFTANPRTDGQNFDVDEGTGLALLTWDVDVAVSGATNGLANVVLNLELLNADTMELIAVGRMTGDPNAPDVAGWYSAINDGDMDGLMGVLIGAPDILANAAFARSFGPHISGNPGPGRIYDVLNSDGPGLDREQLPSVAGLPAASTAAQGTLVGMGAGYSQFNEGVTQVAGVGGVGSCAIPVVSIAEGQLALGAGSYILRVTPGTGNNVLKDGVGCASGEVGSFAMAATESTGSEIAFTVGTIDQVVLVSAASVRTHGAAGAFSVDVPIDGTPALEPRQNGSTPQMVLTYTGDPSGIAASCGDVTVVGGTCNGVSVNGNDLVIDMNFDANACVSVTVGSDTVRVYTHEGQTTPDGLVNVLDMQAVKVNLFQPVDASTYITDVTADGNINILDMQAVKLNLFSAQPTCP